MYPFRPALTKSSLCIDEKCLILRQNFFSFFVAPDGGRRRAEDESLLWDLPVSVTFPSEDEFFPTVA